MDNEHLFLMLDECIQTAQNLLINQQKLSSFAMVLDEDNKTRAISVDEEDDHLRYESLLSILRDEAKDKNILAIALLSNINMPENISTDSDTGFCIHVEEKSFEAENKLSARLIYVPYKLFKTKEDETIQIQLHNPVPVGLACEIFIDEV